VPGFLFDQGEQDESLIPAPKDASAATPAAAESATAATEGCDAR
jgi:hypothetical protein